MDHDAIISSGNAHQILHRLWQEKHRRSEKKVVSEEDSNDTSQQLLKQKIDFEKFQEEKRKFEEDRKMLVQSRVELEDERRKFDEERKSFQEEKLQMNIESKKMDDERLVTSNCELCQSTSPLRYMDAQKFDEERKSFQEEKLQMNIERKKMDDERRQISIQWSNLEEEKKNLATAQKNQMHKGSITKSLQDIEMEKVSEENKIEMKKRELDLRKMELDLDKERYEFEMMKKNQKSGAAEPGVQGVQLHTDLHKDLLTTFSD